MQLHGYVIEMIRTMTETQPRLMTITSGGGCVGREPLMLNAAGESANLTILTENFGICRGIDITARYEASRINQFRWPLTCTNPVERENAQMWVVWSISALVGFCFVLSLVEEPPTGARSRSRKRF